MKSNGSQKQKIRLVWICSLIPPPKLWLVDCDVEVWKLDITSERQMKETLNEKQSYSSPACLPVPSHRNERFQALLLFHMCAEVIIYSLQPVFLAGNVSPHSASSLFRPVCVLSPAETRDGSGRHLHHLCTAEPGHPPRSHQRRAIHREGVWCECSLLF